MLRMLVSVCSSVRPEEFTQESYDLVAHSINASLQKALALEPSLAPKLWKAIETISPTDCLIFSYVPSAEGPLSECCIWSFNYFFYNKEIKRLLFLTCSCTRSAHAILLCGECGALQSTASAWARGAGYVRRRLGIAHSHGF